MQSAGINCLRTKQDVLIKEFLQKARGLREQRNNVEVELLACYQSFQLARAQSLPAELEQIPDEPWKERPKSAFSLKCPERGRRLTNGLNAPPSSSRACLLPGALDMALEKFNELIPNPIALAAAEKR